MLDGKILTAVLASLAAIGTAMNGGSIDSSDLRSVKENPLSTDFEGFMPGSLGAFTEYMKNPEPDTELDAEFEIDDMTGQTLKVSSATLRSDNLSSIKTDRRHITSESDLSFHKFSGVIDLGQPAAIDGDAQVILTNGVNVSGGFKVEEEEVNADQIVLESVERSKIDFKGVSGSIKSDPISTNINNSLDLEINSFSGNITISPSSGEVNLTGRVDKLDVGSVSLD